MELRKFPRVSRAKVSAQVSFGAKRKYYTWGAKFRYNSAAKNQPPSTSPPGEKNPCFVPDPTDSAALTTPDPTDSAADTTPDPTVVLIDHL